MGKAHADRGKRAEKEVQEFLSEVNSRVAEFDFSRLPDARAAMGRMKAMPADFEFFAPGVHGLIEAKETEHDYLLHPSKVPQLARLKKRILAGGALPGDCVAHQQPHLAIAQRCGHADKGLRLVAAQRAASRLG